MHRYYSTGLNRLSTIAVLEVPVFIAVMFGAIAGLLVIGIIDTLGTKSPQQ
jgi:hypothetical protein